VTVHSLACSQSRISKIKVSEFGDGLPTKGTSQSGSFALFYLSMGLFDVDDDVALRRCLIDFKHPMYSPVSGQLTHR
jgi:hypothetical protein